MYVCVLVLAAMRAAEQNTNLFFYFQPFLLFIMIHDTTYNNKVFNNALQIAVNAMIWWWDR